MFVSSHERHGGLVAQSGVFFCPPGQQQGPRSFFLVRPPALPGFSREWAPWLCLIEDLTLADPAGVSPGVVKAALPTALPQATTRMA